MPVSLAVAVVAACSAPGEERPPGATRTTTTTTPGTASATTATPEPASATEAAAELPRGGRELFPRYRLFGYSGAPGAPGLGRLGLGDLDERVAEMEERGEDFRRGRELLPVLELITSIVHAVPGADGTYRTQQPDSLIAAHLAAARRHDGLLLLNIQPGRADFIDEVRDYEHFLVEPDVGVALDPEWAVSEGQVPGRVYGRTTGAELDEVAAYLAELVAEHDLPEKVLVYHQVHRSVVRDEHQLGRHDGVAVVKSVDGIGAPPDKVNTYHRVNEDTPEHVHAGFKLFYEEDAAMGPLMTAEEVLALRPRPEYVLFE
ncbi:hypothetical protein [Ornithinicoccus halotolerans]|uniref:hypothetical protein n=1 Tax=Ornithinicoccus halotolerans TaxID=1748220 RepID=UPI0012957828|nr:hypothetical protein [Ornithinicoccus halotolerans]